MAGRFRHEDVSSVPSGWKVRTVKHEKHRVRVAFPPGRKQKGSGRLVSVLHPIGENPCTLRSSNPAELLIMGANPRVEVVHGDNPPVEEIAEEFSGVDVKYLDVYNEPHIPRGRYAYLAKLFRLLIKPDKGGQVQKITFAEEHAPVIVSDSTGKQIYFVDGNQDISEALAMFTDTPRSDGKFNLGAGRELHYIGKKHHIGDEDTDEWRHKHGEEDGILPAVVFDPINKKLLYEGGNYRIEGPWIHN